MKISENQKNPLKIRMMQKKMLTTAHQAVTAPMLKAKKYKFFHSIIFIYKSFFSLKKLFKNFEELTNTEKSNVSKQDFLLFSLTQLVIVEI